MATIYTQINSYIFIALTNETMLLMTDVFKSWKNYMIHYLIATSYIFYEYKYYVNVSQDLEYVVC